MKGVTHYFFAAALVSLIPSVMAMAVYERSFIIVLGAIAGILPDYIDFKIVRFLWPIDIEIMPDWPIPDAQKIAEQVSKIIDDVWEEKKTITVQFHTIKTGPNTWRQWFIYLDPDKQIVKVGVGAIRTFGGRIYRSTIDDIPKEKRVGEARFGAPLIYGYKDRTIRMEILSGPTVSFVPTEEGVEVVFLPWHRYMSHSITLGALLSAIVMMIVLALGCTFLRSLIYFAVFFVGFSSHILADQFGHMGSNLFWPFTKKRVEGFKITESADPYANFGLFWTSLVILFWRMNMSIEPRPIELPWTYTLMGIEISLFLVAYLIIVPWLALILLRIQFWRPTGDPYLRDMLMEETAELM